MQVSIKTSTRNRISSMGGDSIYFDVANFEQISEYEIVFYAENIKAVCNKTISGGFGVRYLVVDGKKYTMGDGKKYFDIAKILLQIINKLL